MGDLPPRRFAWKSLAIFGLAVGVVVATLLAARFLPRLNQPEVTDSPRLRPKAPQSRRGSGHLEMTNP